MLAVLPIKSTIVNFKWGNFCNSAHSAMLGGMGKTWLIPPTVYHIGYQTDLQETKGDQGRNIGG